jgi:23S rRNA (cytosine1962-C5)-methyltransferase
VVKIILKKNEDIRIRKGHLWIFSNEISGIEGEIQNGDFVNIYNSKNEFLGKGFYNKNSLIACRLLTQKDEDNLKDILNKKIIFASELRKKVYPNRSSYRLVFGEGDFLPGLIIDKYNDTFVLQVNSAGIEKNIELIIEVLQNVLKAQNIFTKNDEYFRKMEGLPVEDFIYLGSKQVEIIDDGSIRYKIDFEKTQKTGFFFDQSDNRSFVERYCRGKKVLDAFCNSGGFGLHAAFAGARDITFVDSSQVEIENAKVNYNLNNFPVSAEFINSDVFNYLNNCLTSNKKFDVVIIDPPAFAKSKKNLPAAVKGYEKLNRLALECINENGLLISSSCSYHLKREEFVKIVGNSAAKAGKSVQLIYSNNASLDHPQNPAMEETVYLKFGVFRMLPV